MKETKDKGKITIRYKSDVPPDPESSAIQFAYEIAEKDGDVIVTVESEQESEGPTTPTSERK